jgi:hypothetical protein
VTRRRAEDNVKIKLKEMCSENVDWIELAQDRNQWWTIVSTEGSSTFWYHKRRGDSLPAERPSDSQEVLGFMELVRYESWYSLICLSNANFARVRQAHLPVVTQQSAVYPALGSEVSRQKHKCTT